MNGPLRRPVAVIFDMDGLMLDTEPLAVRAWGTAAATLGLEFDLALAHSMIGRNFADCSAMLRARYQAGLLEARDKLQRVEAANP